MTYRIFTRAALLMLFAHVVASCAGSKPKEYARFPSPDDRYAVVVYRMPVAFAMPGSSGDAPGIVRLEDKSGKVLEEREVDMVQVIDVITWTHDTVSIKLIAEWTLPD